MWENRSDPFSHFGNGAYAMSNSSNRSKEYNTVHHITSRIAHKVRFLQEEDMRNDLIEIIRRASLFTGIKLLGWCVMINHFHILAFLSEPVEVSEEDVIRRYGILKGKTAAAELQIKLAKLRAEGEYGQKEASKCIAAIRKRMYSISSFMKIVKQWFSEEFNRRTGHKGTLWEGAYYDRIVPHEREAIEMCLGYIHLNPIRAAACATYDGYIWSSYSAFKRGDDMAIDGMRFVYDDMKEAGGALSLDEIASIHEDLLDALLEREKLRRAEEIARKRAAGQDIPADPLTSEAMIAQASEHMARVSVASMELQEQRQHAKSVREKHMTVERELISLVEMHPGVRSDQLMELLGISKSSVYRILSKLARQGVVFQEGKGSGWHFSKVGKQV